MFLFLLASLCLNIILSIVIFFIKNKNRDKIDDIVFVLDKIEREINTLKKKYS